MVSQPNNSQPVVSTGIRDTSMTMSHLVHASAVNNLRRHLSNEAQMVENFNFLEMTRVDSRDDFINMTWD